MKSEGTCSECEKKHYALGVCQYHYNHLQKNKERRKEYQRRPEVKKRKKEYLKEYFKRPEVKKRISDYNKSPKVKKYHREYWKRPKVIERKREYRRTHVAISWLLEDFFSHYNQNKTWQNEGIEKMANLYATNACDITKQQKCTLEEKILIKQKEKEEK